MDGPAIHSSMLWPLLIMALAFKAYFVTLLLARMRMELNLRRIRAMRLAERTS
jgi:heme exporter protein C